MDAPVLLFIDPVCPREYDPRNIEQPGIGGTEKTMVLLAEGLAKTGIIVVIEQHNRKEDYVSSITYTGRFEGKNPKWVVVLRDPNALINARKRFPHSKIYLFSHDVAGKFLTNAYTTGVFRESRCTANVCVSQWHRIQTVEALKSVGYHGEFRCRSIYNPISNELTKDDTEYDKNKLMWLASPQKGLDRAYQIFKVLLGLNPNFKLYVTNPGYMGDQLADETIKENVINLGTIPHNKVIQHLRSSLCLFYPNSVFPETFGKIMAEANSVGTPVLTSPIGASREVLDSHPDQIVDCRDTEVVTRRVLKWYDGARPIVRGRPQFKLSNVVRDWTNLLNDYS